MLSKTGLQVLPVTINKCIYIYAKKTSYTISKYIFLSKGCQFRDHNVSTTTAEQIMQRLTMFRDLIVVPPPKDKREEALSKKGTHFEWGSIVDLTPFKPISSSSLNLTHRYPTNRHLNPDHPSSTEESNHSNSFSDTEENNSAEVGGSHLGQSNNTSNTRPNTRSGQVVSEFWSWNSDFTTRSVG